jgi:hypothetical protein
MEKAQSAMEYLVTYGWAIIIIGVTLAALYALGLFNPVSFTSNQCILPADFGCISGFLYSVNGTLSVNFEQSTASAINITAIGCNSAGIPTNMTAPQAPTSNNPIYLPIGGNFSLATQCYANGTVFKSQPSTLYKGYLLINYTNLQTGFQHVLVGKLIEKTI